MDRTTWFGAGNKFYFTIFFKTFRGQGILYMIGRIESIAFRFSWILTASLFITQAYFKKGQA